MLRKPAGIANSPIARAVHEIGDSWMLLIVWAARENISRFDEFQRELGVARNILSERLRRLVENGLMEKRPISEGARRMEYRLTEKGAALGETLESLQKWGDLWSGSKDRETYRAAE